ncbi:MAG TPA: sigma factor [Solirubrobacteraceae bacterium]|nr:sigma factor [Solirubrobacteraceae bacterium]
MEGSPDPRTDGEVLVASVTDPEAFAIFYRRHVRGVLSFFRRRVPGAELAFDLTAETFAAALEATPRYRPRPEPARGWLYGIAWSQLHEARLRGRADDAARRGLGMEPITLADPGLERIDALVTGRARLERALVAAAQRRVQARPAPGAVVPWPRARRRRIRVGDALSAAAVSGVVIVALAALALLGGGGGGHPASTAAATSHRSGAQAVAHHSVARRGPQRRVCFTLRSSCRR